MVVVHIKPETTNPAGLPRVHYKSTQAHKIRMIDGWRVRHYQGHRRELFRDRQWLNRVRQNNSVLPANLCGKDQSPLGPSRERRDILPPAPAIALGTDRLRNETILKNMPPRFSLAPTLDRLHLDTTAVPRGPGDHMLNRNSSGLSIAG